MRFRFLVLIIATSIVLMCLPACSRDGVVSVSSQGITLYVPKKYVLEGSVKPSQFSLLPSGHASFIFRIPPLDLIHVTAPKNKLIRGIISIHSQSEISKIQRAFEYIKQSDFEEVINKTSRFKDSVTETAKYFDGYVIYEKGDVKNFWTMLAKSPPKSKDDLIGSCTNLEFFNECRIYLDTQDQISIELNVPEEVVGYHKEIVEALLLMISVWMQDVRY